MAVMLQEAEDMQGAQTYYLCAIDVMEGRVDENKLEHVPNLAVCYSFLGLLSENEACFRKAYDYAKLFEFAYHLEFQSLIIPTLTPVGCTFCPILNESSFPICHLLKLLLYDLFFF